MLHLVGIALVVGIAARQPPTGEAGAPAYELVFEGGVPAPPDQTKPPGLPPMQRADVPVPDDTPPGPPTPPPLSPPSPEGAAAAQVQAADSPPPEATAPAPIEPTLAVPQAATPATSAPVASAPPRLAFAPEAETAVPPEPAPAEARPAPAPPSVRLEFPPEPMPEPIVPQPAPQLPPPPPRPRPAPPTQQGTLSNPMDLSFGPAAPRPAARGSVASRAIDLSPPAERQGSARSDPYAAIRAANASADWNGGVLQYWLQHRFYPSQAAVNGEQGSVTIQLTVNRSGRVENVQVLSRSGSQWLDMAAVSTWRDAKLPPFTNEMREDRLTFPIPITYYLIR